jgi:hypothetical protein
MELKMHPLQKTWIEIDRSIKRLEHFGIYSDEVAQIVFALKEIREKIEEATQ